MAAIDDNLVNIDVNIKNAETVKLIVLEKLVAEGKLSKEDAKEFAETFGMMVFKKSWFDKIFGPKDSEWTYSCLKLK